MMGLPGTSEMWKKPEKDSSPRHEMPIGDTPELRQISRGGLPSILSPRELWTEEWRTEVA